jgi:hypothetical protein
MLLFPKTEGLLPSRDSVMKWTRCNLLEDREDQIAPAGRTGYVRLSSNGSAGRLQRNVLLQTRDRQSAFARLHLERVRAEARAELEAARSLDGGWAYSSAKHGRIEPTCWTLLAFAYADGQTPAVDVLRRWPRQDGWLVDVAGAPPNQAFNAIAALTLLQNPSASSLAEPIVTRLIASKGVRTGQSSASPLNASLQAWSWIDGTASWVEPTAWCLLLLKKWRVKKPDSKVNERIRIGEEMLFDRVCRDGGWNYGNSRVYDKDLWPYVPTTALALLALQDRRDHPIVQRSLEQLQKDVASERSAVALALTVICLRVYRLPSDAVAVDLVELWSRAGSDSAHSDNVLARAITLYALTGPDHAPAAFTL